MLFFMMRTSVLVALTFPVGLVACDPELDEPVEERDGIGVLGFGTHDDTEVHLKSLARSEHGLRTPRDLAFNPAVPGELWVVNRADDSVVTISGTDTEEHTVLKRTDPFAMHFMEEVSSLSFANNNTFATCHESRNTYNNQAEQNDFMGPTLWSADAEVFAKSNPAAVAENGFDLGSHLDMLHDSPLCMGIAWEKENIYWTFDGLQGVISRYDFQDDHGPGFDDHADGIIERFVDVDVLRVADIPSHMVFDAESGVLYVADTGNKRIQRFDPASATVGQQQHTHEGSPFIQMEGGEWTTLVGDEAGLVAPSGLALHDDVLYVTDNATSTIHAFSLEGVELDHLKVGVELGGLMGLRVTDAGLFAVDAVGNRVIRSKAKE